MKTHARARSHLFGVALRDLDVERVEVGKLFEQHGLALHDGLAGQRADVAEAQHGGAVGDDAFFWEGGWFGCV
jgi:hypothetical protein